MKLNRKNTYLILFIVKTNISMGINYYVSMDGNDLNSGSIEKPLRTIQAAANAAKPGDIITTGTPPGVGMGMKPQLFLKSGDEMKLSIDNLGEQNSKVVSL